MADRPIDAGAFRAFEHAGWESAAGAYGGAFGGVTIQAVEPLLDAVGAGAGTRLVDVATGPGYAALAAARRGARATGVDFSAAAVAAARRQHPELDVRVGDAEDLAFPDGSFDALVMNFGVLHLARPERALAEAYRVLAPGGRAGFTAWAKPEAAVGFGIVLDAVRAHGNPDVPLPSGPPFFRFAEGAEWERALGQAGFVQVHVTPVPQVWRLPSADALLEAFVNGAVRTAALLRAQTPAALEAIRAAIREAARLYETDEGLAVPMPAVLAAGRKP
jgi:SAM-dependent methyltransferase